MVIFFEICIFNNVFLVANSTIELCDSTELSIFSNPVKIVVHTWRKLIKVQLNEYETTDPYFFQFLQSNVTACLIIYMFCKSSELEPKPKIIFVLIFVTKTVSGSDSVKVSKSQMQISKFSSEPKRNDFFCLK